MSRYGYLKAHVNRDVEEKERRRGTLYDYIFFSLSFIALLFWFFN